MNEVSKGYAISGCSDGRAVMRREEAEKEAAARKVAARLQPEPGTEAPDSPDSPVLAALARLRMEMVDAHYEAGSLTDDLRVVLRDPPAEPDQANQCGRCSMESELAELIQQQVDSVIALVRKLRGTRERLTL